jgi:hypothetical protein
MTRMLVCMPFFPALRPACSARVTQPNYFAIRESEDSATAQFSVA